MSARMRSSAHIVATEARCAVGLTAASAAAAIRAGISRISGHPVLEDPDGEKVLGAWDPDIEQTATGIHRIAELAALGLRQIAAKLAAANAWPADATVLLAFPESRPGFDADAAVRVTRGLAGVSIPGSRSIRVGRVGEGHAGALSALRSAVALVLAEEQELVIAGGVDSYFDPDTLAWLDRHRRLAGPHIRSGFPPGEAAAFIAVASERICTRLRLQSLGRVRTVACTHEGADPSSNTGVLGQALGEAVLEALQDLRLPDEVITDTYGDINGELARTHDWGFAASTAAACFRDSTDYVTFVGQCGDVGAATGALGCILATEAWRSGTAHGPRALVWAGSWSGLRAAAVLEREAV